MSNLENLVEKILDDARKKASIITEDSNKEKEEILAIRIKEAKNKKERVLEKATREAELAKERVISRAELRARNERLLAKQNVIEKTFELAKEQLKSLEDARYIDFLTGTLEKLHLRGDELLIVAEKYISKVPELGIKISDSEFVDSGFLIKDEGIILNYNFDSLVDFYREELETVIAEELFREEE